MSNGSKVEINDCSRKNTEQHRLYRVSICGQQGVAWSTENITEDMVEEYLRRHNLDLMTKKLRYRFGAFSLG